MERAFYDSLFPQKTLALRKKRNEFNLNKI